MMANFDDLFTTPAAPEPPSAPPQLTKEEYAAKKKAERDDLYEQRPTDIVDEVLVKTIDAPSKSRKGKCRDER